MSKHLIYITNNKATILPVTIIAMFILIIVAYACIKIFLIQNIIASTDQLQVRTGYAAEALMEQQKTRIYYQLLTQNINKDTKITKGTDNKCMIEKINGTNNANFKEKIMLMENIRKKQILLVKMLECILKFLAFQK